MGVELRTDMKLTVLNISINEDSDTCTKCGGECCKRYPGLAHPTDFGETDEERLAKMVEALNSGKWTITFNWLPDDDKKIYHLRPRTVPEAEQEYVVGKPFGGHPCTFLTPSGCGFVGQKPAECRELKPNAAEPGNCNDGRSHDFWVGEWVSSQDLVHEALEQSRFDEVLQERWDDLESS
jgi:Fe-S-cluster containining protein